MKRFLLKMAAIAACAAIALCIQAWRNMRDCPEIRYGAEVDEAIKLSSQAFPAATTVLLGDSVGHQLLNPTIIAQSGRTDLVSLTSNQAITALGNRLLLENYLARNPQTKRVVYVVRPMCLVNDGLRRFTFHYLIYPFSKTGLLRKLDDRGKEMLGRRFGRLVLRSDHVRKLLYANDILYDFYETHLVWEPRIDPSHPISEATFGNLAAMAEICQDRGITFHLLPPPMRQGLEKECAFLSRLLADNGFPDPTKEYGAEDLFRPPEDFMDGVHLRPERLDEETRRMLTHPLLRE